MKQRVTFLHRPGTSVDPDCCKVESGAFYFSNLRAAREDLFTIDLQELPPEISATLYGCKSLHIRWTSTTLFNSTPPLTSRISPGLHVFVESRTDKPIDLLCRMLKKYFISNDKYMITQESFTRSPWLRSDERTFVQQLYYFEPQLDVFADTIAQKWCNGASVEACLHTTELLAQASSLDIDYDSHSKNLAMKIFWPEEPHSGFWKGAIVSSGTAEVEVGVLENLTPRNADEVSLAGLLTDLGLDREPKPTMFSFRSRHQNAAPHAADAAAATAPTFGTSFVEPTGLHPTFRLTFPSGRMQWPSSSPGSCRLYGYFTLPSVFFLDKYQLSAPLFLASKNLKRVYAIAGETDLEAPDWAIEKWGSIFLVELATPDAMASSGYDSAWHVDIPLHLRYLAPTMGGLRRAITPWPVVFWACDLDNKHSKKRLDANPFDRTNVGYDKLLGEDTVFYHLDPSALSSPLLLELELPVLDKSFDAGFLVLVTQAALLLGLLGVLWRLVPTVLEQLAAFAPEPAKPPRKKVL